MLEYNSAPSCLPLIEHLDLFFYSPQYQVLFKLQMNGKGEVIQLEKKKQRNKKTKQNKTKLTKKHKNTKQNKT